MPRRASRYDFACAVVLSLLTVLSRLPFRARMLYNWDAVQFALALREYDIGKHQPHPPGYILYVGLGRLANAWLGDPNAAYVVLAVAFSGLTTFVVFYLGCAMYGRATAVAAAAALAVSPLFWFYGSVGLSYTAEALFASIVAYFAYRALHGHEVDAWLAAGYLGVAAGVRQSLLVLLLPLWVGATLAGVRRLRAIGWGLAIMAVAVLTWFVPMIWLTGGLERYLDASRDLADTVVKPTSIMSGAFEVTGRMFRYQLESVLVGIGPLAFAVFLAPWYVRRHGCGAREWFLLGWTVPPVLVYTLVHFGQAGYVLTFLPALVLLLTRVVVAALSETAVFLRRPRLSTAAVAVAIALVVLANGSFFVSARPMARDFDTPQPGWARTAHDEAFDWIFSRTAAALRAHEEVVQTFVAAIRGLYDPADTAVVTEVGNPRSYPWMRHAMFYLPEFQILELQVGSLPVGFYAPRTSSAMLRVPDTEVHVPRGITRLVWFVDHWSPRAERPPDLEEIELPYGRYLYALPLGRAPLAYGGYTLIRDDLPSHVVVTARSERR